MPKLTAQELILEIEDRVLRCLRSHNIQAGSCLAKGVVDDVLDNDRVIEKLCGEACNADQRDTLRAELKGKSLERRWPSTP